MDRCRSWIVTGGIAISAMAIATCHANPPAALIVSANQLREVVTAYFDKKENFEPGDLIDQGDLNQILVELEHIGWKVSDADEIKKLLLPQDHIVARTFATPKGTRFMRKVAGYQLIYDRMHRTAELPGGQALVRDIVKLPNGEIYAKMDPVPGNPTLTELLPKRRNGKTPPPTNFDKPTGYIYTIDQLRKRLEESRERDMAALQVVQ